MWSSFAIAAAGACVCVIVYFSVRIFVQRIYMPVTVPVLVGRGQLHWDPKGSGVCVCWDYLALEGEHMAWVLKKHSSSDDRIRVWVRIPVEFPFQRALLPNRSTISSGNCIANVLCGFCQGVSTTHCITALFVQQRSQYAYHVSHTGGNHHQYCLRQNEPQVPELMSRGARARVYLCACACMRRRQGTFVCVYAGGKS